MGDTALGAQDSQADQMGLADTNTRARPTAGSAESDAGVLQLDSSAGGSGSGLLDLTREGDDTSLGAVLDEIYPGEEETAAGISALGTGAGAGLATGLASALGAGLADSQQAQTASVVVEQPLELRIARAARPFVVAMVLAVVLLALAFSALAAMLQGITPAYLTFLTDNLLYFLIGSFGVALIIFIVGAVLGKRTA